uniref:NACHT domain-containing protein n=1 Tax=Varanus komodoensis TaxID=61221 RepID=A0A8D2JB00_VARKO
MSDKQLLYEQSRVLMESGAAELGQPGFSIINRYVDLKVVTDNKFGRQISQEHEVLAAAGELNEYRLRRKIQVELERISPDRLFRWCPRSGRTPLSVVLSGVAGVGKTTLVQKFVLDWAKGDHYRKFAFVFAFKFRDLNTVGAETTLERLLWEQYPELQDKLGEILRQPEKLLFIFDGLDESNRVMDLRSTGLCTRPDDVKGVEVIVASLLKQTLLEGCSVLLTSRPSRLAHLQTEALHRVVVIAGFLSQERQRFFHNFFCEDAVAEQALAHVRESQVLYTLCYNPSYCWITCTALRPCFTSGAGQAPALPRTVTQLFISYVLHMLANHTKGLPENADVREVLKNLGRLADYGLTNHMLIFGKEPLDAFQVTLSPLRTAFLVENVRATYSFVHLTVQEFFAALTHYLDFREENFDSTMLAAQKNLNGEYDIFLRFLAGLSHSATRAPLKEHLGEFSAKTTKRVIENMVRTNREALFSAMSENGKRRALNFLNLLFEAQNSQLVRQVMGDASHIDFSKLILLPVDCVILAYVLSCCRKVAFLNLDSCYVQAEGLQKLSPQLHKVGELW